MTAQQFKEARQKLGLAQEALARELDISVYTVNRLENAHRPVPVTVELAIRYLLSRRRQT